MHKEIERKWLIDINDLPFSLDHAERHHIVQLYLSFSPQVRLRSIDDEIFVMTIKGKAHDMESPLVREEREFEIARETFLDLSKMTAGRTITKTRYIVPEADRFFEIDVFEDDFKGLVMAEMEFPSLEEAEAYPTPAFARADVSDDPRYRNVVMAQMGLEPFTAKGICADEARW